MTTGVYGILNLLNDHLYIGSSGKGMEKRWQRHRYELRSGRHISNHLQRSWKKYGEASFKFFKIQSCRPSDCLLWEQRWIDGLRPEFNQSPTAGSRLGMSHSAETRTRMSCAHRRRWLHATDEERRHHSAAVSNSKTGKKISVSDEQRRKLSDKMRGNRISVGRIVSAETRARISEAKRGKALSPVTRARMSAARLGKRTSQFGKPWSERRRMAYMAGEAERRSISISNSRRHRNHPKE